VREGEVVRQVDTQRLAKDGRRIDVSISMAPMRDDSGAIVGAVAFTRDISMRLAADERLRRSEAQLAEAQRLAALGSWEGDIVSGEVSWSPELYRILGRDPDSYAATYDGYFEAIHPADRPRVEHALRADLESGDARGHRIRDEAGELVRMVGTLQDVTELAQARQRLEQANRQNEALLNSAADGIYGVDLEGRVTFVNPEAEALTGYEAEATLGRRMHDLVHHTREDGTANPFEGCGCTGTLVHGVACTVSDRCSAAATGRAFRSSTQRPRSARETR
jgi:PAS domain-containing protein